MFSSATRTAGFRKAMMKNHAFPTRLVIRRFSLRLLRSIAAIHLVAAAAVLGYSVYGKLFCGFLLPNSPDDSPQRLPYILLPNQS
jgi:hypothetical protein